MKYALKNRSLGTPVTKSERRVEVLEVAKLRTHLELLREEYVKLQNRHAELEKKYQVALATAGSSGEESGFICKLLSVVADLFNREKYSDMRIKLSGETLHGHHFVLSARSEVWANQSSGDLDLTQFPHNVSFAMMKWAYTDSIDFQSDESFHLSLLKASKRYMLAPLSDRCEQALMSSVSVRNCIMYYQTAEEIAATALKEHCSTLISSHWEDFTSEDFESMPAALAYKMFKSKTEYPLHTAIRTNREDVLFLYLVEHDSQLPGKLNQLDNKGDIPLDIALQAKYESIAQTLVKHRVNVNQADEQGHCLLHKAITRGDEFAASFLIQSGCSIGTAAPQTLETALHLVASYKPQETEESVLAGMTNVATLLLQNGASANMADSQSNSPLHKAVLSDNEPVLSVLLAHNDLDLELPNGEGHTALALALQQEPVNSSYGEDSFAARLLTRGCSPDAVSKITGDTLLHKVTRLGNEVASLFLVENACNTNLTNINGETALHVACAKGQAKLANSLLCKGANPNAQTTKPVRENSSVWKQTPLHLAIENTHQDVIQVFLDFKSEVTRGGESLLIIPNFTLKDSEDQTALALALWHKFHGIAIQLMQGGASVNDVNSEGLSLLHQAIMKQDADSASFLIQHGTDVNKKTRGHRSPLQLAIKEGLTAVVEQLCTRGADMNVIDPNDGDCPLWQALESAQQDVASILVRHGCDTNMWGPGPEGCQQTLLHKAIDENNEASACFLVRSLCDVNCTRRLGEGGEGAEVVLDQQTPLHMCCAWGLQAAVQSLIEHNADVNIQDAEGKSALHIAIENQHHAIISLLLSDPSIDLMTFDRHGVTPFAAAMATRNNKAAQAILDRAPQCAEQYPKGKNFLHTAILKNDIESVLFLLSVHVDVNSRTRDSDQRSPLHLATRVGNDMICRNLLLAGARVNDVTPQKKTSLHLAAEYDQASLCQILIENKVNFNALDDSLNNALHIACQLGHLGVIRVLLTESQIDAEAVNMRGQNPMHVLGQYGKENAAAIFELFMECMPKYPVDVPDINGNTVLLLAYFNGNGSLCRAVVRAGAGLGKANKEGVTIFNAPVATKQLLFKLLDMLSEEPPWTEGEVCLECGVKFSISTRRHHCRHCGRLLCSKCSSKMMPIVKYSLNKPTRVCEICFDVLSYGMAAS